ncbi:hypothetical protein [uncultured Veillonella sp.]|uniref:hypothetical protein n=1 Tax=uncultured Veillonella sp. TaxID=159268 RepID=UPI0028DCACB3|nr:hypothetical protein [uncultured Veillonella sp.]
MKENIALFLAILYLIYRYKTYKNVNKIIEDRIENVHKPFFKRVQEALQCSQENAEKVGLALDKYFVPLESKFTKIDDNTYSFVNAGGLQGTFSIDQNYKLLTLVYNNVDLLALEQNL